MGSSPFLRFVLRFGVLLAALNLVLLLPWVHSRFVYPWTVLNASCAAWIANLTGKGYEVGGTLIQTGTRTLDVEVGCNGVEALALCLSAMLAFPSPWKRKAVGILLAVIGVFGLNLIRLANLLFVAKHYPDRLELFHIYVWQNLMAAMSFGLFLVWGRFLSQDRAEQPRSDSR